MKVIFLRDVTDFVGAEKFSALRHPGYEWVDPQVKLPLSRFSKFAGIVDYHNHYYNNILFYNIFLIINNTWKLEKIRNSTK